MKIKGVGGSVLIGIALLLMPASGCVFTEPRLTTEQVRETVRLRIGFDVTHDGKIDAQDRKIRHSEPFHLGVNNSDADGDGSVDWANRKVEDFSKLRRFVLRRCTVPSGPFELYLVAQSVPVRISPDTHLETAGHVRVFDLKGHDLLPPDENASRRLPRKYLRILSKRDMALYIEGVHGFNTRVGIELRTRDGAVLVSDYQEVSMIGPTAVKITTETELTPYRALECFRRANTIIIDDFAIADKLIKAIVQEDRWEKPRPQPPPISPLAKVLIEGYVARKQFIIVGGSPSSINTFPMISRYVTCVLKNADAYVRKAKHDAGVGAHMLTLITYLDSQKDEDLDFSTVLRLCRLAERAGARRISDPSKKAIDALKGRCRKKLGRPKYFLMSPRYRY